MTNIRIASIDIHPKYNQTLWGNEQEYSNWVIDAALGSDLYLTTDQALLPGDCLFAERELQITDHQGKLIGTRKIRDHSLIKVAEVTADFCLAHIDNFGYQQFFDRLLPDLLATASRDITFMEVFPYSPGQALQLIPREESMAWSRIREVYGQLSGSYPETSVADIALYGQMIDLCDDFLWQYGRQGSHFLPDAIYQKGFALHKLKRFRESNEVFHRYLDEYPNGPSVTGANNWIHENNQFLSQLPANQRKTTILFLAANPDPNNQLRLDLEVRDIERQLRQASLRDQFSLVSKWAVTPDELQQAMLDHDPDIVHFSGHGVNEGIYLEGDNQTPKLVSTDSVSDLFRILAGRIRCVVLNACYSQAQASRIVEHIPYVVGMSRDIPDKTAIGFAVGFYKGLCAGKPVDISFELGTNLIRLEGYSGAEIPQLLRKDG